MKQAALSLLLLSLLTLNSSITSIAQTANQSRQQKLGQDQALTLTLGLPGSSRDCPIDLRIQHAADGDMMEVDDARPKGVAQRLHLVVMGPDSAKIVAAKVTVRGYSDKGRMLQASSSGAGSPDASRTVDVYFPLNAPEKGSAFLWVAGLTAVQVIDLVSLTYADGSTWNMAQGSVCRVIPDPTMLIASH